MADRDTYTHGHHPSVLRSHRWRTAENSAGYLLPHLTAGQRLLDVGCGPGSITLDLAAAVAPGQVTGIDAVPEPLAQARVSATERAVTNVDFVVGDAYALDWPDASFDVVHAHQVLQHLSDPVAALTEMLRVCRPDGVVAVRDADYAAMTWYPHNPLLDKWLQVYEAVARTNRAEPDAGRRLRSWALAAGASDVESSASVWCYAGAEQRAWWGGLWAERVRASALAEQAVAGGHATTAELAAISDGWLEWAAREDAWFAVLNGEVLCRPT